MSRNGFEIIIQSPHPRASEMLLAHCADVFSGAGGGPCAPRFVYLAPTRRKVEHVRELLLDRFGGALFGNCVMTLSDFFTQARAASGIVQDPLSDTARMALIEDILSALRPRLQFIRRSAGHPGLARKIGTLFSEFKQNIVFKAEDLEAALGNTDARRVVPRAKASDLALLFDEYLRRLHALGQGGERIHDAEDAQFSAGQALKDQGLSTLFPGAEILILEGFYDFNPLQRYCLSQALATAPAAVAALEMDPEPEPGAPGAWRWSRVFALPKRTLEFYRVCRDDARETVLPAPDDPQPMRAIGARLFRSARADACPAPSQDVLLISPRDQRAEVVEIARRIKRLAHGPDAQPLSRIAVVFPALENYELLVREEFERHGVPCQISAGRALVSSPVCSALSAMLDAARNGFPRPVLFRFLASPFVRIPGRASGAAPDPFEMDLVARAAQIAGGSGAAAWRDALARHRRRVAGRMARNQDQDPSDVDSLARLDAVIAGYHTALDILEPLSNPSTPMAPDAFANIVMSLIRDFGIRDLVCAHGAGGAPLAETRKNIRALMAFENVLEELAAGLALIARGGGPAERPAGELMDMLRAAMANARYTGGARARGGVHVMGLLETRSLDFDVVFLGGLLNDVFPKKDEAAFFLDPRERAAARIESIRADISEDRFLFRRLFHCTRTQLVVSWPAQAEERDNVPSLFVDELKRHVAEPDNVELASLDRDNFYCRDDACQGFGSEIAAPDSSTVSPDYATALDAGEMRFMAHNMDAEWERRYDPLTSAYQGRIASPAHLPLVVAAFAPPGNSMGVTSLEAYTRCPFRFFVSRLLGIEAIEEVEEDITALDRGTLLHAVVEQFYRERYDREQDRIAPVPADSSGREQAERRLVEIAETHLSAMRFSGVFWDAWRDSLLSGLYGYRASRPDLAPGTLKAFLDFEARDRDWCRPRYLESNFDERAAESDADPARIQGPPLAVPLDAGRTFFIKGKVDRIDTAEGGRSLFFVVDYKSYAGKPGVNQAQLFDAVNAGRDFQLPVYMILAGRVLGAPWQAAGAALYALSGVSKFTGKTAFFGSGDFRDPKAEGGNAINSAARKGFVPGADFEEILNVKVIENIRAAVQAMHAGYFNPDILDTKRTGCVHCDLSRSCRFSDADTETLRVSAAAMPGIYLPEPYVTES